MQDDVKSGEKRVAEDKSGHRGFTPGPWTDNGRYGGDQRVVGANGKPVIYLDDDGACGDPECCGSPSFYVEINAADLPLIIAAPEMLGALEMLAACIMETRGFPAHNALVKARAALARARGDAHHTSTTPPPNC